MTAVDWTRWRKCPVCAAPIGAACRVTLRVDADGTTLYEIQEQPHGGRKPRTGGA